VLIHREPSESRSIPELICLCDLIAADETEARPVARIAVGRVTAQPVGLAQQRAAAENLLSKLLSLSFPDRIGTWLLTRLPSGAPRLGGLAGTGPDLQISMSHRADWVAAGLTTEASLGVDVEIASPGRDTLRLARFMGWESDVPCEDAFYRRWVRWEAYCKCRGGHLLSHAGPEFECLSAVREDSPGDCWQTLDLKFPPGTYAAAVLRMETPRRLTLRELSNARPSPW
jgi:hypothetical protein